MDESQDAEEDLLAFLQPLTMPDEFTFEARARHFEDSSDDGAVQEPIPGPAPPAPMAPMAPVASAAPEAPIAPMDPIDAIEPIESVASVAPEAAMTEPNGAATLLPPETNGHKEDKTEEEQDDDAIEYETPKPARKSPAKRPTKSRPTPRARPDDGDESSHESAAELLKRFENFSAKKRVQTKPSSQNELGANGGGPARTGQSNSPSFETEASPEPCNFEVVIKPLPPTAAQEYIKVDPGDEIYRVLEVIRTDIPGEAWLSVEFEDGRVDQVSRSYKRVSSHFRHRLASLTPFSSHPHTSFGNEPSAKLSTAACTPLPLFTSFHFTSLLFTFFFPSLLFTSTISFPVSFHKVLKKHLPTTSTTPGRPSSSKSFPNIDHAIEHTSWGPRLHITRYFSQYPAVLPQSSLSTSRHCFCSWPSASTTELRLLYSRSGMK